MEFDWIDPPFDLRAINPREVEESFEDPFSIRLLPDNGDQRGDARYISLGRSLSNRPVFSVFWTDGKSFRVIFAREMTTDEAAFYDRKNAELL